jgi:excisionase family DNA binding protein
MRASWRTSSPSNAALARSQRGEHDPGRQGGAPAVLSPSALAEYLSISERTVRDMLSKQRIPSYKVEGQRRIDPADVEKYLARNRNGRA